MAGMAVDRGRTPVWLWAVAGLGVAWNAFGIVQLFDFVSQTHESLMMKGMSPAAADLYYGLPIWMKLAFALGSIGGLFGSAMLAVRRAVANSVLAASLLGNLALFAGDHAYGVFDVIKGQMAILTTVVAISAGLLAISVVANGRHPLQKANRPARYLPGSRSDRPR